MVGDPNDSLEDVLAAPLVIGPRQPTTIAQGIKLARKSSYHHKLALAEADLDRWLTKLMRAAGKVDSARKAVKRYRKIIREE